MLAFDLSRHIDYEGKRYALNLSYDNVLRAFELSKDETLPTGERLALTLEMFAGRKVLKLPLLQRAELYNRIFKEFINTDGRGKSDGPRALDFTQDAPYIYGSFKMVYGIDLVEQRNKLDWRLFTALLHSLPEQAKLREIMSIRQKPVPEPTVHNQKEIQALMELKSYWRIEISEEEAEAAFQADIDKFAAGLEKRARVMAYGESTEN